MTRFPKTAESFAELEANYRYSFGMHFAGEARTAVPGLTMGDVPFDYAMHHPGSVNPLSVMGVALKQPHVTRVLPNKPVHINMVTDFTNRSELPSFTRVKRNTAELVASGLADAIEGSIGNIACRHLVGEQLGDGVIDEFIESRDRSKALSAAEKLSRNGLTILLSDFQGVELPTGSLKGAIAIKVDHLLDYNIPEDMGTRPVAPDVELNTDKPSDLAVYNAQLQEKHEAIMESLRRAGALVVPVVADHINHKPYGIDIADTDERIAQAILALPQ